MDGNQTGPKQLTVYMFNVGQGDHILLELPNGEYGIVDFYYETTLGLPEPPALTYLENLRRARPAQPIRISFLCISHPDYDHVKGVNLFLDWAEKYDILVKNIWLPPGKEIGELCKKYEAAVEKYAKTDQEVNWGQDYKIRLERIREYIKKHRNEISQDYLQGAIRPLNAEIDDLSVILVAPLTEHMKTFDDAVIDSFFKLLITKGKAGVENNLMSSVLLMLLNEHRLLFGGDTTLRVWVDCLDAFERSPLATVFGPCEGTFIKASHHGSRNSSSEALWKKILSEDTVVGISAGRGKGHPHEAALRDIQRAARHKNSKTQVLATNSCTECIMHEGVQEEKLGELASPIPNYAPETKITNARLRPPSKVSEAAPGPALAAYVFRFSASKPSRQVTKVLMSHPLNAEECRYTNNSGGVFPDCATNP